ncbi:MAG: hypothetical protein JNN25_04510 [Candidatus Kapabacteria bacterium]|nr:hypothetical protein [Candidatus Kapabacteria bacterium]
MSLSSLELLLPNFLPARPSAFAYSLCESAWRESLQAHTLGRLSESTTPKTLAATGEALLQLYASFFRQAKEQQSLAETHLERLTRWGVWEEYPRMALPQSWEQVMMPLRGIVTAFPEIEPMLRQGHVPDNIVFRSAWRFFCFRYGQRALHEGDIALPRFAEDPKGTFAHLLSLQPVRKYDDEFPTTPKLSIKARLLNTLWQKYVHAQHEIERQRSETMQEAYSLRQAMLAAAEQFVQKGRLQSPLDVWNTSIHDLAKL